MAACCSERGRPLSDFIFFRVLDFLQDILGQILLRLLRTSLAEAVAERLTEFENMSFGLHEKAAF